MRCWSAGSVLRLLVVLVAATLCACESPESSGTSNSESESAGQPSAAERSQTTEVGGVRWSGPIEVATGNAYAGPWRMNQSDFNYVDDASVEVHANGTDVIWVNNHTQKVKFRRFTQSEEGNLTSSDSPPAVVSDSPETFSWLPRIETAGEDARRVYVLWQEIVFSGGSHGGEAFFARSTDGGDTFEPPVNLSNTQMGIGKGRLTKEIWHNGSLDIAVGHGGNIYGAWTAYQGPLEFRRSTDRGKTFDKTINIAPESAQPARAPSLALGPDETIYIAWTVGEDQAGDLRLAVSRDAGRSFSEPVTILSSDGHSDAPKIATKNGKLHLVYGEAPEGMFEKYHVRYASTALASSGENKPTGPPTFGESRRISEKGEAGHFPSLGVGETGTLYALWNHYDDHDEPPRGLKFAVSSDGGTSFEGPWFVPGTEARDLGINGSLQGMLMEKLDVRGRQLGVANSRFEPGNRSLVRLFPGYSP